MKRFYPLLVFALAMVVTGQAFAQHHRGRVGVGVYIGGPYWGPYYGYPSYYYPPPYYYYPAAPAEPQVYVERIDPAQQGFWYYCEQERGYYPYVKECPAGWRRVPSAPPPG